MIESSLERLLRDLSSCPRKKSERCSNCRQTDGATLSMSDFEPVSPERICCFQAVERNSTFMSMAECYRPPASAFAWVGKERQLMNEVEKAASRFLRSTVASYLILIKGLTSISQNPLKEGEQAFIRLYPGHPFH